MPTLRTGGSAGEVLGLIAAGTARTRSDLCRQTGLSRATVSERLEVLFRAQLVSEGDEATRTGGRPSRVLTLSPARYVVLAADVGEDHVRLVATDLAGTLLGERLGSVLVAAGPDAVLGWVTDAAQELLSATGHSPADVLGLGLSVPAPVDWVHGQVTGPSVMTGWAGVDIASGVQRRLDVPVLVENDVNARGYGELAQGWQEEEVFYVKAGTGIGSAILSAGHLFRGALGAAGDIGHIRLDPENGPLCRCGAVGCVEAMAAGWSIVRDLRLAGIEVADTRAAVALAAQDVPEAVHLLRRSGRTIGRAIAYAVSLLNPGAVVVTGSLAGPGQHLLTGIRESVYAYCLPLATNEISIVEGRSGERGGALGMARLVVAHRLTADRVNTHLRSFV